MLKKPKLLLPLLILCVTSGCATGSTAPVVISDYCRIAKPLSYDTTRDSVETVKEVEKHNSKWVCLCENDCPNQSL